MEVEGIKISPESYFSFLVQQVENQSDLCDVTVKLGMWEKKFHRCVLAASPFFEIVTNGHCAETRTDIVEMKIDTTPNVLDMALMFLYGLTPTFTINNAGYLLELAEFLLLKGLKSVCINWLNSLDFTEVSCMYVIQLSTKYNFEVTTCIEFIESHLPQTFQTADAGNLSKESVEYIFGDRKFSYVKMDDKLSFLIKWVRIHPNESIETFNDLFKYIDLQEVSSHIWENTKRIFQFNKIINMNNIVHLPDADVNRHNILIMSIDEGKFCCLDIEKDRWYQLSSNIFNYYNGDDIEISGIRNTLPELYFTEDWYLEYSSPKLSTVNLETGQIHTYSLTLIDEDIMSGQLVDEQLTNVSFTDDTVVVTVNKIRLVNQISDNSSGTDQADPVQILPGSNIEALDHHDHNLEGDISSIGHDTENVSSTILRRNLEESLSRSSDSESGSDRQVTYTEVYIGHVNVTEDNIEMSRRIVLRNETISQVCLNRLRLIGLLMESRKYVIIFDIDDSKSEIIKLVPDQNYKIVQTDKGFLVYNDKHCYCVDKLAIPFFSKKYKVKVLTLENEVNVFVQYHYLSGIWMRVKHRNKDDDIKLEYASHEDLSFCQSPLTLDINWTSLSVPEEKEIIRKLKLGRNMFVVPLSKRKLRCDIACPHCKYLRFVDSDDREF